ncbi:hypothetical protein TNCT_250461, partial [Trichonephila clavata]
VIHEALLLTISSCNYNYHQSSMRYLEVIGEQRKILLQIRTPADSRREFRDIGKKSKNMSMKSSPPPPPPTTEESEKPLNLTNHRSDTPNINGFGKTEKRWGFHPYRFPRDEDIVFISRTDKRNEDEESPKYSRTDKRNEDEDSPYTPCSPNYPPSSPSLPDLPSLRNTPVPTPAPEAAFPTYNLIKTYFSTNFVQYIPHVTSHINWGTSR